MTITSPADASTAVEGASVDLIATADDAEHGDLTASIDWTSDQDAFRDVHGGGVDDLQERFVAQSDRQTHVDAWFGASIEGEEFVRNA